MTSDSSQFQPPSWSYAPRSVQQAQQVAQLQQFKQQAAPLVNQPDGFSQAALSSLVDQQQQDPGQAAQQQNDANQAIGGKIADFFRGAVPQGARDAIGSALQAVSSPEKALNTAQDIVQNRPMGAWDTGAQGTPGTLGTDVGNAIGNIPAVGPFARQVFDVGAAPAALAGGAELGAVKGLGAAVGAVLSQNLANAAIPQNANPLLRGAVQVGAGLIGGIGGAGLAGAAQSGAGALSEQAAQEAQQAAAPEAFQQSGALPPDLGTALPTPGGTRYVPSIAGGADVLPQPGQPSLPSTGPLNTPLPVPPNMLPPTGEVPSAPPVGPFGPTADEIRMQNAAALARANGDTTPVSPMAIGNPTDPVAQLMSRISDAKPLQQQNAELLSQFRSRQAGAFQGALGNGPGGEAGFNQALGAMRGQADQVNFEPLRQYMDPSAVTSLFDSVTSNPDLRPFERAQAGSALQNILNGTVPTPSALGNLETAFPGITKALQSANIISGPSWTNVLPKNLTEVNNAIRSANTFLDVAFAGRLGPQAGLMFPRTFANAVGQAWSSVADPGVVQRVLGNLDDRAVASAGTDEPLPTIAEMRSDYGVGAPTSDTAPGLLGKIPVVGRVAKVYQNFMALLRPQMLHEEIMNRYGAGTLTAADLQNPSVTQDLGRAINLISGKSSIQIGDNANLLFEFPNWLAAQGELIQKALTSGSITGQMARQSLMRLAAFGAGTTAAINLAQGKSPLDGMQNGVPMAHVPGTNLTVDMFGPLGELLSKGIGLGTATVKGAQQGGVSGAIGGLGGEAAYDYRSLASPLAGIAIDQLSGKDIAGRTVQTGSQRLMNLIEHVAPIGASQALTGTREPAAQALGAAGLRVHQPSPSAALDEALTENQAYGAPWAQLSAQQREAARNDPSITPLIQANDAATAAKQGPLMSSLQAQQQQSDDELIAGKISRQQWQGQRATRLAQQRVLLEQQYGPNTPITDAQAASDPKAAYLQAIQQSIDPTTGQIDPLRLEEIRSRWTPQQNTAVDNAVTGKGTPLEQNYRQSIAQFYNTTKYPGYTPADSSAIDRAYALVQQYGQQFSGTNTKMNEQRAFLLLQQQGTFANLSQTQQQGVRRLMVGAMTATPQRALLERQNPMLQYWFGSNPLPGQRQAALQTLQNLPKLAFGGVSTPMLLSQYAKMEKTRT